jgi:hypothetical protein
MTGSYVFKIIFFWFSCVLFGIYTVTIIGSLSVNAKVRCVDDLHEFSI